LPTRITNAPSAQKEGAPTADWRVGDGALSYFAATRYYYQPLPWLPLKTPAPPWQLASAKPSTATAFPHTSTGIEIGIFTVLPLRIETFPTLLT
jgi:hypothetical protein